MIQRALSRVEDSNPVDQLTAARPCFELPGCLWQALVDSATFSTYSNEGVLYGFIEFHDLDLKYGVGLGCDGELMRDWFVDMDGHFIDTDLDQAFRRYALKHVHQWRPI